MTVTGPVATVTVPPHVLKEIVKAKHLVRTVFKTLARACTAIGIGKG